MRDKIRKQRRTKGGAHAARQGQILDRDGQAVERLVGARASVVHGARGSECAFGIEADDGVELRIERVDARQGRAHQFLNAERTIRERRAQRGGGGIGGEVEVGHGGLLRGA